MTLNECYKAAMDRRRIVIDGIVYKRIVRAGFVFDEKGTYTEFAEAVEMKTGHLVVTKPESITLLVAESGDSKL